MSATHRELLEIIAAAPSTPILDMFAKTYAVLNQHDKVMVSISGGSDSDILLDAICTFDQEKKARYVFFNTGLEYEATKRHLADLESKYDIVIEWVDPVLPIPTCCRTYGVPFWSKQVSEYIYRLQKHGFKWEDEPFDLLLEKYPKCTAALRWWCNAWPPRRDGKASPFSIAYTSGLKEFMISNPPNFKISARCCEKAKKQPAKKYTAIHDFDLNCTGIRMAEKGARATRLKTCFSENLEGADSFRPLFWLTDQDKQEYKEYYGIVNSDCYEVWGMKRTGCCGCPYGKEFEQELELMQKYEPKLHRAALKIFGASYDYTRQFLEFRKQSREGREA